MHGFLSRAWKDYYNQGHARALSCFSETLMSSVCVCASDTDPLRPLDRVVSCDGRLFGRLCRRRRHCGLSSLSLDYCTALCSPYICICLRCIGSCTDGRLLRLLRIRLPRVMPELSASRQRACLRATLVLALSVLMPENLCRKY